MATSSGASGKTTSSRSKSYWTPGKSSLTGKSFGGGGSSGSGRGGGGSGGSSGGSGGVQTGIGSTTQTQVYTSASGRVLTSTQVERAKYMTPAAQQAEYGKVLFSTSSSGPVTASEKAAAAKRAGQATSSSAPITASEKAAAAKRAGQTSSIHSQSQYMSIDPTKAAGQSYSQTSEVKPYSYAGNIKAGLVPSAYAAPQTATPRDQSYEIQQARDYYGTGVTKPYGEASVSLNREQLNTRAEKPFFVGFTTPLANYIVEKGIETKNMLTTSFTKITGIKQPEILKTIRGIADVQRTQLKENKSIGNIFKMSLLQPSTINKEEAKVGINIFTETAMLLVPLKGLNIGGNVIRNILNLNKARAGANIINTAVRVGTYVGENILIREALNPIYKDKSQLGGAFVTGIRLLHAESAANFLGGWKTYNLAKGGNVFKLIQAGKITRGAYAATRLVPGAVEAGLGYQILTEQQQDFNIFGADIRLNQQWLPSKTIEGKRTIYNPGKLLGLGAAAGVGAISATSFAAWPEFSAVKSGKKFWTTASTGAGYTLDVQEAPGDIYSSIVSGGVYRSSRVVTPVFAFTPTASTTNIKSSTYSYTSSPSTTKTTTTLPSITKTSTFNIVKVPTISTTKVTVPSITNVPALVDVSSRTRNITKVTVPSITNVPALVNVPSIVNVPSVIDVPALVDVPAITDIISFSDVPSMTNVMTPNIFFPPMLPDMGGGGGKGWGWLVPPKRKTKYTRSLYTYKGKMPKLLTGLEIRPIV